jgi:hypothetical protein
MVRRWRELAKSISTSPPPGSSHGSAAKGELLIIGSGIAHVDLTMNDEMLIRSADRVFHCTNDRVTQIWINAIRPDALDLRILYDKDTNRFDTYVQMAEAILHCVRRGERVVAVYYGHPGIFATPGHRALRIARAEGYVARMRPGISALDYLIADVGFDPMIPGLLSYEASDLLLARRTLDTALHIILWQVGVVGEFRFSSTGFENRGFDMLVDELEQVYGREWDIVHYIAPLYAGVEPLIERYSIGSLKQAEIRSRVTSDSTFYIPPMAAVAVDQTRAIALGFAQPDDPPPIPERDYDLAKYDAGELAAIGRFASFRPPAHYKMPGPSPAAEFMLALSQDPELQARYREDPARAIDALQVRGLSPRARKLLAMQHPLAINAAISEPPSCETGVENTPQGYG